MLLKELVNKSVYGTIGYIALQEDLDLLERYILHNLPILKEFKQVVVAINYSKPNSNRIENEHLWKKYFPNCVILNSNINRGHNFGTADLDNMLFDYCKENNEQWLFKSANDVLIQPEFLNQEVDEADFYYINGIGYGGMEKYNFDFNRIKDEDFYPQTNYYFINVSKCDYLNNKQYIDETYNYIQTLPEYNGRIWEYIQNWSCEDFLKQCVERNKLTKYHLINPEEYLELLNTIKTYNIHDSSYKNIMVSGLCHYHFSNQSVLQI